MPVLQSPAGPTHDLGHTTFTSLATPTRGSTDTSVWMVEMAAGTQPTPHQLTREEVFVVLEGAASARIDGEEQEAGVGDAIVVPAGVAFALSNAGDAPLRLLCCMPVGGQARLDDGTVFTPPWAL